MGSAEKKWRKGGDAGEEDVDIGEDIPIEDYPSVEIERDGTAAAAASGGSSSSGSSSSSGGSSSSGNKNFPFMYISAKCFIIFQCLNVVLCYSLCRFGVREFIGK